MALGGLRWSHVGPTVGFGTRTTGGQMLPMSGARPMLLLWMVFLLLSRPCHGDQKSGAMSKRHLPMAFSVPERAQPDGLLHLEDARNEQSYYLEQLFLLYGENGTLSFHGLTKLLQSLGLGQVQVVEIKHEDLGHGHVSHLDLLEVQEQRHTHIHSSQDHVTPPVEGPADHNTHSASATERMQSVTIWAKRTTARPTKPHVVLSKSEAPGASDGGTSAAHQGGPNTVQVSRAWAGREVIEHHDLQDHKDYNHLHEDCLNVTQLLLNFGLSGAEELTPQQFSLVCPALLYQIDSRVCIRHHDEVRLTPLEEERLQLAVFGFGFLALTLVSVPSLLAVLLVPLLSRSLFRFLLTFLVALAVGTLCGDALLHLLPHAQGGHSEAGEPDQKGVPEDAILKGLTVLAGIYLLFLIENLLGLAKRRSRRKSKEDGYSAPQQESPAVLPATDATEGDSLSRSETGASGVTHHCSLLRYSDPEQEKTSAKGSLRRSIEDLQQHSGHSHGPRVTGATGIADIAWMVILGDGIHNFTDGLAIGAAFSQGIPSGLSTSVAVLCHELPHELGDFAVLLQAGMPVRRVVLFSLLSAFLGYLGMFVGAVVSQSSARVTPWIFAVTAGIFLYVALVDMLPDMLQRDPGRRGQMNVFILRNVGFLLGAALMLCIALFEEQIQIFVDL